jgi:adenosylcobinamide kinase/adenosylcobinamide-phosphate guanylyltransferase
MVDDDTRTLLVLGGARSGKSRHAQALAEAWAADGARLVFIATAQAFDGEMRDRIARHQADRDARWTTIEAPTALAEALRQADDADAVLLVDCLTLWASNLLLSEADNPAAIDDLVAAIRASTTRVVLVANEVGLGIVPDNALARRFRDWAGTINQRVAAAVDRVDFIAAGLPLRLK